MGHHPGKHASVEVKGPGLAKLQQLVNELKINPEVKVGVLANTTRASQTTVTKSRKSWYDSSKRVSGATTTSASNSIDRKGGTETSADNVDIAIINEFGTATIPSRPFIGTSGDHFKEQWLQLMARTLGLAVDKKISIEKALEIVGQRAAADMKTVLRDTMWQPNAPSTIAKKGSSRPLIDSRQLLNSISYGVKVGHSGKHGK